jgi:hypothetical protein
MNGKSTQAHHFRHSIKSVSGRRAFLPQFASALLQTPMERAKSAESPTGRRLLCRVTSTFSGSLRTVDEMCGGNVAVEMLWYSRLGAPSQLQWGRYERVEDCTVPGIESQNVYYFSDRQQSVSTFGHARSAKQISEDPERIPPAGSGSQSRQSEAGPTGFRDSVAGSPDQPAKRHCLSQRHRARFPGSRTGSAVRKSAGRAAGFRRHSAGCAGARPISVAWSSGPTASRADPAAWALQQDFGALRQAQRGKIFLQRSRPTLLWDLLCSKPSRILPSAAAARTKRPVVPAAFPRM